MAVNGDISIGGKDDGLTWNTKQEVGLFQQVIRLKPIGGTRQWKIMCIRKRMQESFPHLEITSDAIWNKLKTMFDLQAIEEMEKEDDDDMTTTDSQFELPEEFCFPDVEPDPQLINSTSSSSESDNIAANGLTTEVPPLITKGVRSQRRRTPSVSEEPRMTRGKSKSLEHASEVLASTTEDTETAKESPVKPVDAETLVEFDKEATRNKDLSPELEKPSKKSTKSTRRRKKSLSIKPEHVQEVTRRSSIEIKKECSGDENDPEMPQLEPAGLVAPETPVDDEVNSNNTLDDDIVTPLTPAQPQPPKPRKKKIRKQSNEKPIETVSDDTTKTLRAKRSTSRESKGGSKKNVRSANTK